MNTFLKIFLLTTAAFLIFCRPSFGTPERYDEILEVLDNPTKEENCKEGLPPSKGENIPKLSGIWILKKTTIRRLQPALIIPVLNTFCNATLPIEKWDFERKVVISEQMPGKFVIRNLHPQIFDVYAFPRERDIVYSSDKRNSYPDLNSENIIYQNFGFKGLIDPEDLTYAYSLRLVNFRENENLAREIFFNSRVYYERVTGRHIIAKGYETYSTPLCHGFVRDDIKIELRKIKSFKDEEKATPAKNSFVFEDDISVNIPEVKHAFPPAFQTLKEFDTAKDKSGFKPSPVYKPIDTAQLPKKEGIKSGPSPKVRVPGMW